MVFDQLEQQQSSRICNKSTVRTYYVRWEGLEELGRLQIYACTNKALTAPAWPWANTCLNMEGGISRFSVEVDGSRNVYIHRRAGTRMGLPAK